MMPSFFRQSLQGHLRQLTAAVCAAGVALGPGAAQAQGGPKAPIVRDAETEQLLRDYMAPIFRAAGINGKAAQIVLVNDRAFNAFVANGQKIFINVGALLDSETPNEIVGVLAHETGHIQGGHLARLRQELTKAKILSVVGMLAGAGAVVGASQSGGRVGNSGQGAMGTLMGGSELAQRHLLAYQRTE